MLANDWANRERTLNSYELIARYVIPHFKHMIEPLRSSYEMVAGNKATYGKVAMAAITKAYDDAGKAMPTDLNAGNLR